MPNAEEASTTSTSTRTGPALATAQPSHSTAPPPSPSLPNLQANKQPRAKSVYMAPPAEGATPPVPAPARTADDLRPPAPRARRHETRRRATDPIHHRNVIYKTRRNSQAGTLGTRHAPPSATPPSALWPRLGGRNARDRRARQPPQARPAKTGLRRRQGRRTTSHHDAQATSTFAL